MTYHFKLNIIMQITRMLKRVKLAESSKFNTRYLDKSKRLSTDNGYILHIKTIIDTCDGLSVKVFINLCYLVAKSKQIKYPLFSGLVRDICFRNKSQVYIRKKYRGKFDSKPLQEL